MPFSGSIHVFDTPVSSLCKFLAIIFQTASAERKMMNGTFFELYNVVRLSMVNCLSNDKIQDQYNLKAFANAILNVVKMMSVVLIG